MAPAPAWVGRGKLRRVGAQYGLFNSRSIPTGSKVVPTLEPMGRGKGKDILPGFMRVPRSFVAQEVDGSADELWWVQNWGLGFRVFRV